MVKMRDVWDLETGRSTQMAAIDASEALRNDPKRYSASPPKQARAQLEEASGAFNPNVTNSDDSGSQSTRRGMGDATVLRPGEQDAYGIRESDLNATELAEAGRAEAEAERAAAAEAADLSRPTEVAADVILHDVPVSKSGEATFPEPAKTPPKGTRKSG